MIEVVVNLDNCAREPIHIPGAIQAHGLLFVLREPELTVIQMSDNVAESLGIPEVDILNQPLTSFLSVEQRARVRFALDSADPRDSNPVDLKLQPKNGAGKLDGFVHHNDGFSFLELEPASLEYNAQFLEFYKLISKLTSNLHNTSTLAALLEEAARGVRAMTRFERVMIYRFADNFEGEVLAEARGEQYGPFLGLWFPASDIPEQARNLYVHNPIRAIVDSAYQPVYITPAINPDTQRPVDLSHASLRSVSPLHCEYLRNMGVRASMSVSILRDDKLWGLIACHHHEPRHVPYELRKACTFIGEVISSEISRREIEQESQYHSRATLIQAKFLELMAGAPHALISLISGSPNLLDLIPCEGAAVVSGDKADMIGNTPGYADLVQILGLFESADLPSTFVTRSLKNHFPLTEAMRATASGVIALEIERTPPTYVFFFRPEVPQTVKWGGDPTKPVDPSEDGYRLSPRKSFEIWKEEIKGYSLPWTRVEVQAATDLRNLISVVLYSRGGV